jgi:hypothetical protein
MNPGLADNANIVNNGAFQGVYASKAGGMPVDPLAIGDAESTVQVLSGAESEVHLSMSESRTNILTNFD